MIVIRSAFNLLFEVLEILILIDVVLSWVYRGENVFTQLIHTFTEPFLAPGRKIQDKFIQGLPVDLSPIFALIIISLLRKIVLSILGIL
ncbi:YggT family protein [Clostridium aestuarii]|uniref:YggT family protein n=2 Tax=Clostridium aestuarii TaxID=338193 RepID=A0ABT4CXJ9_9CLOT|nr:YggT family protein [Clostridium aestuarii]MCY6483724.1 YggT family protein [Clostridium aestuarii]